MGGPDLRLPGLRAPAPARRRASVPGALPESCPQVERSCGSSSGSTAAKALAASAWLPALAVAACPRRHGRDDAGSRARHRPPGAPRQGRGTSGGGLRAGAPSTADAASAVPSPPLTQAQLRSKWITFWCCFFGYSVCYFTRQSLSYTAPFLKRAMGWEGLAQLGQLSSLFPLAYGSSRFLGGVLGDRLSPSKVFCLGLSVCGMLNVAFALSSTLPMFAAFWFVNGCFQGLVAPPCVKMITNWFDPKERGFWWSIWHASINLGGFLIPFLAGGLAENFGWRYGMLGPGALAVGMAGLCLVLMRDGPTTQEKRPAEASKDDGSAKAAVKPETTKKKVGLVDGLLSQPTQWALGVAYMLVYVCRQGLGIWGVFYLMHSGVPSAAKAAALFSGFELGGFLGNLTAGACSDFLLRRAKPGEGEAGQRAKVVGAYFLATLVLLPLMARCPSSWPWVQYALLLGLGHFLCGSQLLLPLIAAEVAPKELTSTATGFIGWVGYFGAAMSGLPLSRVVQGLGWGWYFSILTAAAGLGAALLVPLTGLKSYRQLEAAKA